MNKEFVIKVGNLFAKQRYVFSDELGLTAKQHDAARFEEEGMKKAVKWFRLYEVPHTVWQMDGELRIVNPTTIKTSETV